MSIGGYVKDMYKNPERYNKFWVAILGFVMNLVTEYFEGAKWLQPLIAAVTAGGVIIVPNKKGTK